MKKIITAISIAGIALQGCNSPSTQQETNSGSGPDSAVVKTVQAAFVYSLPLALMDITRKKTTNYEIPVDGTGAPINQFTNFTKFPDATFRSVVRPNADTYYDVAMLDLGGDAIVLSLPNTNGRYYLMPMLDAFTNVFASPGKRTTGTAAGTFLITGPKWVGTVPNGMKQIKAPTNLVWIIGRIQTNSPEDGQKIVVPIQKKILLTPLGAYGKPYVAPKGKNDPTLSPSSPNEQIENMPVDAYFNYINQLLAVNPPPTADSAAMGEFLKVGIGAGASFKLSAYDTATQGLLKNVPKGVVALIKEAFAKGMVKPVNGWSIAFKNFGDYGTDYQLRAAVAYVGLGANLPEDAIYPTCFVDADGNPFEGTNKYVIHFEKGQMPPVNAFWSLTMYDKDGFFIANPINRYAIGDRSNLKANPDGSVDIYFQNTSPGKEKQSNWLPSPTGSFNLILRMYWPKDAVLTGNWTPPAVKKII